ncbi:hypothetical protein P8625_02495 [Tenacibaculum tangerinum]|uniref:Uncharacterized protein n=1 Tax=Tenacibaculum tangerinum TaxID=3038772 RepID=A0ABY8L462_9FLAO|nr:hypothetical protein [Tenacibaculum tangerinum]WGH76054.1 hypothetical protein P8625_02495 [Tenacibaculum tangerinum]
MDKILIMITLLVTSGLYTINSNSTTVVPESTSTETTTNDTSTTTSNDTGGETDQDPDPEEDPNNGGS